MAPSIDRPLHLSLLAILLLLVNLDQFHSFSFHSSSTKRQIRVHRSSFTSQQPQQRIIPKRELIQLQESQLQDESATSSSPSPSSSMDSFPTNGPENDPTFERLSQTHVVLQSLRQQIPTLLTNPLTEDSSQQVYTESVQLVVDDIVLASSRQELVSLSTTLVLAVAATNQANSFLGNVAPRRGTPGDAVATSTSTTSQLQSEMAIDPNVEKVRVQWNVTLPGGTLQGVSELQFNLEDNSKVKTLRLLKVQWNQERLNARAIGESLASLRQLVLAVQDSPLLKTFLPTMPSLSSLLGNDLVQQLANNVGGPSTQKFDKSPLMVADKLETAYVKTVLDVPQPTTRRSNTNSTSSKFGNNTTGYFDNQPTLIPINDFQGYVINTSIPLPGSRIWQNYVQTRQLFGMFLEETLAILSGQRPTVPSSEILQLFATTATLQGVDGRQLMAGCDKIGNYFHTLASWRTRAAGTWECTNTTLVDWNDKEIQIEVDYLATSSLPGTASPVVIEGRDLFILLAPKSSNQSNNIENEDGDDEEEMEVVIQRIEQLDLQIRGPGLTRPVDGAWFMKSLVQAMDTGRFSSVGADSVVMDLLQRAIAGEQRSSPKTTSTTSSTTTTKSKKKRSPKLSDSVKARIFTIMMRLHQEIPALLSKEDASVVNIRINPPPLAEFLSDTIELRGYLGETLARGSTSYNRAIGTTFASLKAALATGSVKVDEQAKVRVELTPEAHIRLSFQISLKVLPLPSATSDLIQTMSGSTINLPSGGFPLDISIVSDYVPDQETGTIYQHRLVETRINGQLTPGDVVSKWLQKQVSSSGGGNNNDFLNRAAIQTSLVDIVSWVRSFSNNSNRG